MTNFRPAMLAAILAALACPAAAFDPYDPAALNEAAAASVGRGDLATAEILLERAARIAPYDARIVRNRDALRARAGGSPAPAPERAGGKATAAPRPPAPEVPAEPPALWPPKR